MLAMMVRSQKGSSHIEAITNPTGTLVSSHADVLSTFREFYADVYSSKFSPTPGEISSFLDECNIPQLSALDAVQLNAPLTTDELLDALALFSPGKSQGSDGLPAEVYKRYSKLLIPHLKGVFEDVREVGRLPHSMNEAFIVLLLKPGKEVHSPDSYRPISLLTTDVKLLVRALVTRLAKVIHKIIHNDQSGFIPSRSTALNIRRLFLNLQIHVDNPGRRAILSLDAAKVFHSIKWPYLWAVLRRFGLGDNFIQWVKLLYAAPKARIPVNGDLSDSFSLFRGTRQGYPLSPLLFALALEPLAIAIRSSTSIVGFNRGPVAEKVSLYADDALLYLGDTDKSLTNATQLIQQFGSLSGFTINWSKSVLMPIDDLTVTLPNAAEYLKVVSTFKHLNIWE